MLNELYIIENAAKQAGIELVQRHPDIKDAGKKPTLHVLLDKNGHVTKIDAIPLERLDKKPLWKLSEGQKNSFPFVQPKPFWKTNAIRIWKSRLSNKPSDTEKREALLLFASNDLIRDGDFGEWTSTGMIKALTKRRKYMAEIEHSEIAALPVTIDRFLLACNNESGSAILVKNIIFLLIEKLKQSTNSDLIAVAVSLLTEAGIKSGALYFNSDGDYPISLIDNSFEIPLCRFLRKIDLEHSKRTGICSVTGENIQLVTGNFSQPNIPIIQQTFLFSRNEVIPSLKRYGKTSIDSMLVGYMTDIRLRSALEALTINSRKDISWKGIPRESTKEYDLLLAFVQADPDIPIVESIIKDDYSEEEQNTSISDDADSIATFEKRTERLLQLVKAKVGNDVTKTPVQFIVIRKVDPANRKVIYSDSLTVANLYNAAVDWIEGERNVPDWLTLQVFRKGISKPQQSHPPHVAPLSLISFFKEAYVQGGTRRQKLVGISAIEVLRLFLDSTEKVNLKVKRILRLLLSRRSSLLIGISHTHHTPLCWNRRKETLNKYNVFEALRTLTILCVLLNKLKRKKEIYMNDTAFKLGQLLAAADILHAGYCADVRGGAVPPSLLGNQVFIMAQTSPQKALASLSKRWKPYAGWAMKTMREQKRIEVMVNSKDNFEKQRGWDIRKALKVTREISSIAEELVPLLKNLRVDDVSRAELLLGYIAGLKSTESKDSSIQQTNQSKEN